MSDSLRKSIDAGLRAGLTPILEENLALKDELAVKNAQLAAMSGKLYQSDATRERYRGALETLEKGAVWLTPHHRAAVEGALHPKEGDLVASAPPVDALEAFRGPEMEVESITFENECGERFGTPSEAYELTPGEGFTTVNSRGRDIGVIFHSGDRGEVRHLAFMGSGIFCGEHDEMDAAVHAIQVSYFG